MAIISVLAPFNCTLTPFRGMESWTSGRHNHQHVSLTYGCSAVRCSATAVNGDQKPEDKVILRRSGNYMPTVFSFDIVQSLNSEYSGLKYAERAEELKEEVTVMLRKDMELLECVELFDNLERLGIAYLFEPQIDSILRTMFDRSKGRFEIEDLYAAALTFRVFRHYGYHVPQEIFNPFINENGEFDPILGEDTKGMLALYDVSFLSMEGETKLDLAREFTRKHLKENQNTDQKYLSLLVQHSLELPVAWSASRIEARWYISAYEMSPCHNPLLLELAKLDFNIVQATYQQELKYIASWWEDTRIAEKLTFGRERVVELFFWSVAVSWEPQHSSCRIMFSKLGGLGTVIDDLYDVYGTMEELELFTDAMKRWDVKDLDELPDYMKMLYLALFNAINDLAYDALKVQGAHIIKYITKGWADYCNAGMQEARWYYSGYTPSVEKYLPNATVTSGMIVFCNHIYAIIDPIDMDVFTDSLDSVHTHSVVRCASLLVRLMDDLATSTDEMKRGDVPKILECRMKQTGCSEEEAKEYVWCMISETWKKLFGGCAKESQFSTPFLRMVQNMPKIATVVYGNGDGYSAMSNSEAYDHMKALLIAPIPIDFP